MSSLVFFYPNHLHTIIIILTELKSPHSPLPLSLSMATDLNDAQTALLEQSKKREKGQKKRKKNKKDIYKIVSTVYLNVYKWKLGPVHVLYKILIV